MQLNTRLNLIQVQKPSVLTPERKCSSKVIYLDLAEPLVVLVRRSSPDRRRIRSTATILCVARVYSAHVRLALVEVAVGCVQVMHVVASKEKMEIRRIIIL